MYCLKCGAQIPDVAKFCPGCGKTVNHFSNTRISSGQPMVQHHAPQGTAEKLKKQGKKSRTVLIVSACVFVLACAILIPVLTNSAKAARYKEAIALKDSGEVVQAKEAFIALDNYKESADLIQDCQNTLDYNAAKVQMDAGDYTAAKQTFEKLGDFGQAAAMAAECDYSAAIALMAANNNKEARDAFLNLGEYKDASKLAAECNKRLDYDAAKSLLENKNYNAAMLAFTALNDYSDSAEQALECQNQIDYIAADTAFGQGKNYTAYVMFTSLGGYADSAVRAGACIQSYPATGELYRNENYSSNKCALTIVTAGDGYPTFLKFYTEDDILVSTMFLPSGEKTRIKLPIGTYKIKTATGSNWFGTEEMFGDEGNYQLLTFGNDAITTSLKSNYTYTLTLRSSADGNVGSQNVNREGF